MKWQIMDRFFGECLLVYYGLFNSFSLCFFSLCCFQQHCAWVQGNYGYLVPGIGDNVAQQHATWGTHFFPQLFFVIHIFGWWDGEDIMTWWSQLKFRWSPCVPCIVATMSRSPVRLSLHSGDLQWWDRRCWCCWEVLFGWGSWMRFFFAAG